jgi:hypothetical protein
LRSAAWCAASALPRRSGRSVGSEVKADMLREAPGQRGD